ncbi:hypothetical protein ONE63_000254 [Megalurothrips usitatus]|uniref:Uncharacterized protein n=1 Tax=Megalurothrips usitatus TaxID=439358 RepID=A0AAV7XYY0_9NEOP|nr:hypothetical protein ONE63_000254 [Megalurothrips usitatus]
MTASALEDRPEKAPPGAEERDYICEAVGSFGRWQLKLTFLLSLVNIPCTWHIFVPTFQAASYDNYSCQRPAAFQDIPIDLWRNLTHPFTVDEVYSRSLCLDALEVRRSKARTCTALYTTRTLCREEA